MARYDDGAAGCAVAFILLWFAVAIAWVGFLIWAGINIVNWLITK